MNHSVFFETLLQELSRQAPISGNGRHSITLDDENRLSIWVIRNEKFYPVGLDKDDNKKDPKELASEIIHVVDEMIKGSGEEPPEEISYTALGMSADGSAILIGPNYSMTAGVEFVKKASANGLFVQNGDDVIYFPVNSLKSLVLSPIERVEEMKESIEKGDDRKTIMQIIPDMF